MNRVINININGIIFHIDEEAYVVLERYLESLKQHFRNNEGGAEILADIESRIAEMLTEMIKDRSEVVSMENVQQVIATMGKPEDMDDASDNNAHANQWSWNNWGYKYNFNPGKRMYRDTDNKIIGGVCSGIGEYIGMDPVWIRLLFVAVFFGFGTGLLIYIILWIILPAAKSPSEKLEMRGERVNISNIEKTVSENLENIKQKINHEFDHFQKKDFGDKVNNFFTGLFDGITGALGSVFHAFAWLFSLIFILISACVLIVLVSVVFGITGIMGVTIPVFFFDFFHNGPQPHIVAILLLLVIGLPFLGIMFRSLRYISGYRRRNKYRNGFFSFIWVICIIALIALNFGNFSGFRSFYSYTNTDVLKRPVHDTLYISATGIEPQTKEFHGNGWIDLSRVWKHIQKDDDTVRTGLISFDIARSEDHQVRLEKHFKSRGGTVAKAITAANDIHYNYSQNDSILWINESFHIAKGDQWHGQNVHLELQIPDGVVIKMKRNMNDIIYDIDNVQDMDDEEMPEHTWIMKPDGLSCLDCGTDQHDWNKDSHRERRIRHRNKDGQWDI